LLAHGPAYPTVLKKPAIMDSALPMGF
jgi:hypothetical protein